MVSLALCLLLLLFMWALPQALIGEDIFTRITIDVIPITIYLWMMKPDEDCFHCYTFNKEKEFATLSIFQHIEKE